MPCNFILHTHFFPFSVISILLFKFLLFLQLQLRIRNNGIRPSVFLLPMHSDQNPQTYPADENRTSDSIYIQYDDMYSMYKPLRNYHSL